MMKSLVLICCAAFADRLPDVARLPRVSVYVLGPTLVLLSVLREHGTIQREVLDAQVRLNIRRNLETGHVVICILQRSRPP